MAQPSEVIHGLTQRPAPAADDSRRSGSGSLCNGQIGQGSPTLPGENDYNSDEVKYGKPESRNQPGSADTSRDFQRRGALRAELPVETATQSQPVAEYRVGSGDPDYLDNGKVNDGQKDKTAGMGDAQQHSDNRARPDGITRESDDDSRLVSGATDVGNESDAIDGKSTGGNPIFFTGEKSSDQQNQQLAPAENSTGEKKKGRGRPKKQNSEKPFSPQYYEWRGDSGGWKLIHRPPLKNGKLGYEYVGFLNPKRWEFFRRYDDERFIKAVTRLFEKRKQGRSVRSGGLRLVG